MHGSSKVFYLILLLCMLPYLPAIAEEKKPTLFNSSDASKSDDKSMRGMSWNNPKPKDEKVEEAAQDEENIDSKEEKDEEVSEEELTPEQKLWEKYKKLAEGTESDAEDNDGEDKDGEDDENSEEDEEALLEEEKIKQESIGLKSIIEDYKNSQKNKGNMNSRSFGNID